MQKFMEMTQPLKNVFAKKARSLRGVPLSELEQRLKRTQDLMEEAQLDCLLLSTE